jgi:hypothetical protein
VPAEVDLESELPDISAGSASIQYFIIANMDESMPNRQGRAWCDKGATEWRKVYDREGAASPDNVTIELNGENQLKVTDFTVDTIDENRDKFTEGETYSMKALLQSVVNKIDGLITKPPDPPGPSDDIIFNTYYASSITYYIPTSGTKNGANCEYNWTVFVDDVEKGTYTGTSSGTSTGISLGSLSSGNHTITIKPADGNYYAGWGAAFGYWSSTSTGANSSKSLLTAVIQDPDWAHLYTATDTGDNFRYNQFYGCSNLTAAVPETLPDTVTRIGDNFRAYQYFNSNTSSAVLSIAANEFIPDSVISIGNNFRAYQYYTQGKLTDTARESLPDSVTSIGGGFRMYQYYSNASSVNPVFSVGSHIHSKQFATLLNANTNNYLCMFYVYARTMTDGMPSYYLEDGVTTQPVTVLTPETDKNYVTNRTGIVGYSSLNANWK